MADEWFELADRDHFWMQWRCDALERWRRMLPEPGALVMEVGCGNGVFLEQLEQRFGYTADGCDLNRQAMLRAAEGQGELFLYDVHTRQQQLRQRYQAVFLMDVIEHVDDDVSFLADAAELAEPGGLIVVNVPCSQLLFSKYDEVAGHQRRYGKEQLRTVLVRAGLEPLDLGYWGFSLLPILVARNLLCFFSSREKVIERGFAPPGPLAHTILHSLRRFEIGLLKNPPFGTSLLGLARVPG